MVSTTRVVVSRAIRVLRFAFAYSTNEIAVSMAKGYSTGEQVVHIDRPRRVHVEQSLTRRNISLDKGIDRRHGIGRYMV